MIKVNSNNSSIIFTGDNMHNRGSNIIRSGESFNRQKQNFFLGNKRKPENEFDSQTLLKLIKNSSEKESGSNSDIISKKIEYKLSHVLHGENTVIRSKGDMQSENSKGDSEANSKLNKTNKPKEFFNDELMDSMMGWTKGYPIGPGLNNLGNTCFLNSVLQSLLYTPSLRNYLTHTEHLKSCKVKGICFLCEVAKLISYIDGKNSQRNSTPNNSANLFYSITPKNIIQNLHLIAKTLRVGRQEDSHEFLLYMLDALEKSAKLFKQSSLNSFISNSSDNSDNLVQKIFGGKLISSVTCSKCKKSSNKIDNILDVSLQISNADNLEKSFETFCKPEYLVGNNKFHCENCKTKNDSVKRFQFEKLPRVLVLHLKRFDNFQRKINKFVKYDNVINLTRFVHNSSSKKEEFKYRLYSVLIHDGFSVNSGHYYCYVKNSNGGWYSMNDSNVSNASEKNVFHDQQTPYILFYERIMDKPKMTQEKNCEKNVNVEQVKLPEKIPQVKQNTTPIDKKELLANNSNININKSVKEIEIPPVEKTKIEVDVKGLKNELNKDLVKEIKKEQLVLNIPVCIINDSHMCLENVISKNSSECDTQDSEEINSIKSFSKVKIKFQSPKITKMKALLSRMKAIQMKQKCQKNLEEPSQKNIKERNSNKESFTTSFSTTDKIKPNTSTEKYLISAEYNSINKYAEQGDNFQSDNNPYDEENYKKKNSYHISRHFTTFYGTKHIEQWDTEEDSDLLSKQMDFIHSSQPFERNKTIQKDEYDVDYDTGKLKKVKKHKEQYNHNVFQRHHDYMAHDKNNAKY